MALEFTVAVCGRSTPDQIVVRLYPDDQDRPRFRVSRGVWFGNDRPRRGFTLHVASEKQGYFGVTAGDDGPVVETQPAEYVHVGFVLDKERAGRVNREVLELLARLLATGDEDVLFIQNSDILLLCRHDGAVTRYAAGFWETLRPDEIPAAFRVAPATPPE
jgi:hypothetical protein